MVRKADQGKTDSRSNYSNFRQEVNAEIQQDTLLHQEIDATLEGELDLEAEVGMQEVGLDEAVLDSIPSDTTDDSFDRNDDDIEDEDEGDDGIVSDLPQAMTESYGTGLQGAPSDRAGYRVGLNRTGEFNEADAVLTGGDVDANYEQANAVGDEAVGGTAATPDQDVVDELGAAVGLEMNDRSFLRTNDVLEERDDRRWELDPKSSEDYGDRRE